MKKVFRQFFKCLLLISPFCSCLCQQPGTDKYYKPNVHLKNRADSIDDFLIATGATGGLLIAQKGEVLLRKGYGWADEQNQIVLTSNSIFDIGSVTKQFTATAILKLAEQGKLNVTDSITKFFKNVPADKQNITIHHLLTHTAGFEHDIFDFRQESPTKNETINKTLNSKLKFEPGIKYSYSNLGYIFLAIIIEEASGTTYENYLFENVFKPADMMKTGFTIPHFTKNELALGYDISGPLGTNQQWWDKDGPNWGTKGAGAILSNLEDLYKWHLALKGETIISKESKQKLFTPYIAEDNTGSSYYGYGWAIFKTEKGTTLITHDGFGGIFFTNFLRYVDEDIVIIYFTSERRTVSKAVFGMVSDALFGKKLPVFPRSQILLTQQDLKKYTGNYQLPSGSTFTLYIDKKNLELRPLDPGVANLLTTFPISHNADNRHTHELQIKNVIDNIAQGNFETVRNLIFYEGDFETEKNFWKDKFIQWENRFGKYKKSEIIGSVRDSAGLITYILIHFEQSSVTAELREMKDRKFYIGTPTFLLPAHYRFIPKSKTEFEVYNYTLNTSTIVNFNFGEENVINGLTTQKGDRKVNVKKIK